MGSGQSRGFTYWNNATYFVGPKIMSKKKDWHESYVSDYNLSNLSFKGELSEFSQDKHSIVSDKKMFVDAENGDFRLAEKSAAIDAGRIIELNGWRSEYSGRAPDIGAYEGEELLPGPPFRFDDSSYQEAPRVVQVRAKKSNLQMSFSVPITKKDSESISIRLANGSVVNIACTLNAYDLSCLLPDNIQINQIESVSISSAIKGKNGLPVTLWAAPTDGIKIQLH